jgi:hypothetical protein
MRIVQGMESTKAKLSCVIACAIGGALTPSPELLTNRPQFGGRVLARICLFFDPFSRAAFLGQQSGVQLDFEPGVKKRIGLR